MSPDDNPQSSCPLPIEHYPRITLAHGGGGRLMHQLIERLFLPAFDNPIIAARHDGAVINLPGTRIAMSTDTYVVRPLFFPGGDIGSLAVNGTVNDLAMCGARPLCLSVGLILEEGLSIDLLAKVVESMRLAAAAAGVSLVTGDTKVVEKGKGDCIFINTSGVGIIDHPLDISPAAIQPGDRILLSGDLGRHAIAIMATREGLSFESTIESDCAPLAATVTTLLDAGIELHCLRDLTRGGLASALVELAESSHLPLTITESAISVSPEVRGACEILGLDPLYLANEGRFIAFVPHHQSATALAILKSAPAGAGAALIGEVSCRPDNATTPPRVLLATPLGTTRVIEMLSGEQLPRIC